MKILFSNPPWFQVEGQYLRGGVRAGSRWPFTMRTNSRPDAPVAGEYAPYPMFLGFAASWCQRAFPDAKVTLRDSLARRESYETFLNHIVTEKPDYVVIESATPSWEHDKAVCKLIKQAHPAAEIIITGTVTTTRKAEIVSLGYVAVLGEYEKGVVGAIKSAEAGAGRQWVFLHDLLTSDEMNAAPFPMYDEEYALAYWDACPSGQQMPHLQIWTSRGCFAKCCFCAFPAVMTNNDPDGTKARKVRFYSPEYVEAMIRDRIEKNPGIKSIYDDSDIFNMGDKHTIAMSSVFKRFGLPWTAMCRADSAKLETWNVMKDSGCVGVKVGMESGSQYVIDKIVNKGLDLADVENRILPYMKLIGLNVHTTWTVGLPGETPAQANETLRMIERLYEKGLHQTHQLSGTATIEGTPLQAISEGATLKAYPGATTQNFTVSGDGQAKIEDMRRQLQ
jgi:radical SAM superfamily enzyme YgiQ (UPF0313 family)